MQVIYAPHPTLRKKAQTITKFDKRFFKFVDRLKAQLLTEKDPEGVGLAAPQVNKSWQVFVSRASKDGLSKDISAFINPEIVAHAAKKTLLEDSAHFEGCLSVRDIYGPVPRWDWLELKYQTIDQDGQIIEHQEKFEDFPARVIQHEYDHLQGTTFIQRASKLQLDRAKKQKVKLDKMRKRNAQ